MFRWLPYPFLRFTPALIAGVLISIYTNTKLSWVAAGGVLLFYGLLVAIATAQRKLRLNTMVGLVGLAGVAVVGVVRVSQCNSSQDTKHLLNYRSPYSHYVATVTSTPEQREKSWRVQAQLESVIARDSSGALVRPTPVKANLLLYQPKSDSLRLLRYGDRIVVSGSPQEIKAPANPGAFDQKSYWGNQQIHHQHYLQADYWQPLDNLPLNPLARLAYRIRQRSQAILSDGLTNSEVRGIALALVLGVKDQLDNRVREAYGHAGAMHVLAVSGLHIGIVYTVLAFLLLPLKRIGGGRIWHALACIAVLWLFALVTGGSVSVVRAATMFTCVILADTGQRHSNIYNTLALSAFLLLLINPYYLLSVGFQLSYLAVLGIVYLQPRIYRWFRFQSWLADKIWALTAVSVAAQLATLPISIYYFHQLPTYFWLANLFVIPAAFVILSLGLLTILSGLVIPTTLPWLGELLSYIISGVNTAVYTIELLPISYIDGLHIDLPQTLVLYAGLVAALMLFYHRRFRYLVFACGATITFTAMNVHKDWEQEQKRAVTFYRMKDRSAVDFTQGFANYHWGVYDKQSEYQIIPHWQQSGLTTVSLDTISDSNIPARNQNGITLVVWQGQRIAFVHDLSEVSRQSSIKIPVDYLVVSNNAARKITPLNKLFSYDMLVIDSSNSWYRARQLAREADSLRLTYHSVPAEGAFQAVIP